MEKNIENIISNFFRNQCDENQLEHPFEFHFNRKQLQHFQRIR
jgi:hypothetical protein